MPAAEWQELLKDKSKPGAIRGRKTTGPKGTTGLPLTLRSLFGAKRDLFWILLTNESLALRHRGIAIPVDELFALKLPAIRSCECPEDRSLICPRNQQNIMQLNLAADGVEELEQLDYLGQLGCEKVQGFFFSEDLPKEKISFLLNSRTTAYLFS